MDTYQETFKTWDKVAESYNDKFMRFDLYNDTYDVLLDLLPRPNATVLDVGCGPGNITNYLLAKNAELHIKGIDISAKMIEFARRNNPPAGFQVMDIRQLATLSEKYDAIVCGFCTPYLSQCECSKLIGDCKHLLNSSGLLYISFVAGDYANSGFISGSTGDRMYFYYHSLDDLTNDLRTNSFEILNTFFKKYEKTDGAEDTHTIVIAIKQP